MFYAILVEKTELKKEEEVCGVQKKEKYASEVDGIISLSTCAHGRWI